MKKDIEIPEVKNVHVVILKDIIAQTGAEEWGVYIINDLYKDINTLIVLSEGFSFNKKTSTLRKSINHLPKKSFAKLEIIQEELFEFTNLYKVSFFIGNDLYDKTFKFSPNSIGDNHLTDIPLLSQKGILAK